MDELNLTQLKELNGHYIDDVELRELRQNKNVVYVSYMGSYGYFYPTYAYCVLLKDDTTIEVNV